MKAKQILTEQALHKVFEQILGGSFAVSYKNGETKRYGEDEPKFSIRFNDDQLLDLIGGDMLMSFGEAYMNGRLDIDGDIADLMSLALRNGLIEINQQTNGLADSAIRMAGKLRSFKHKKGKHRSPLRSG